MAIGLIYWFHSANCRSSGPVCSPPGPTEELTSGPPSPKPDSNTIVVLFPGFYFIGSAVLNLLTFFFQLGCIKSKCEKVTTAGQSSILSDISLSADQPLDERQIMSKSNSAPKLGLSVSQTQTSATGSATGKPHFNYNFCDIIHL